MLKLYVFEGAETEWVAAENVAQARHTLKVHYGIDDCDIDGSYESVSEVDPASVDLYTDAVDAETEEEKMTTAAAVMEGKTKPFLVASTYVASRASYARSAKAMDG